MGNKVSIDYDEVRRIYDTVIKWRESRDRGTIAKLDRIRSMAILEAFFDLGLVNDDNELLSADEIGR